MKKKTKTTGRFIKITLPAPPPPPPKYDGVNFTVNGKIFLVRCPKCRRENCGLTVADGVCAHCAYAPKTFAEVAALELLNKT